MNLLQFMQRQSDRLLESTLDNLWLVLVTIGIATVLSVGIGVAVYRRPRWSRLAQSVFSIFLTIPSFALFGLMIPIFGLGAKPVIVALVMYSLLPITRNTVVGLQEVDPAIVDAARGMGMSRNRIMWRIELPLAWPVIITGIRVATQIIVGISAIAAFLNAPGLGTYIFRGLSTIGGANATNFALSGTLLLVLLGLALDLFYLLLGKLTTPRGIRV